jgi:beta-glucosidase
MTLDEKLGQLAQVEVARLMTDTAIKEVFGDEQVGSVLSGGGEIPSVTNDPEAWAAAINRMQKAALDRSRLGIPILYGADAPHGLSPVLGATIFPQQIGIGATRDPALAREIGATTARAAKALGMRWIFGPIADIARDLRWGRYYETYSEDPKLASSLVAATVQGLQGESENELTVAATAKHFIGYSQPPGGRDCAPAHIPAGVLKKWFEPSFQAAIDAGVASVMNQHASLNGEPVAASHALLTTLLRDRMGFDGVTISDWGDIENLVCMCSGSPNLSDNPTPASSDKDAVRMGINAGIDVSMIPDDSASFTSNLKALVESGAVPQKRLDEAVRRVLALKFRLGLFEHPYVDPSKANAMVTVESDRDLARKAVDESLTLLKNSHDLLPLEKEGGPILVVGPAADNVSMQMGGWTIGWQGIGRGDEPPAVTIAQGIREQVGARNMLTAKPGKIADVLAKAKKARAVVVAVGEKASAEWLGDNPDGALGAGQPRLVKAVEATGKPVVLVLVAGRPLMITSLIEKADAFLMAYLPGTEAGHGVADVLFGRVSPQGKLPFSWPASIRDVPMVKGRRLKDGRKVKPLFPYGAGLTYRKR